MSVTVTVHDEKSLRAIDLIWNNQIKEAIDLLTPTSTTIPRHSLHIAEAHLVRFILSGRSDMLPAVIEACERASRVAEEAISAGRGRIGLVQLSDLELCLADANLVAATTLVYQDKKVRAAWKMNKVSLFVCFLGD